MPSFRPTYSSVVATLALFVALGGTGYAVTQLPKNSVGSAQVKNHSLRGEDLASGVLTSGPRGPRGSEGPTGPGGAPGPIGPSDAYSAYKQAGVAMSTRANVMTTVAQIDNLPAGNYLVSANVVATDFTNAGAITACQIVSAGNVIAGAASVIGNGAGSARAATISMSSPLATTATTSLQLQCDVDQALTTAPSVQSSRLNAVRVSTLH